MREGLRAEWVRTMQSRQESLGERFPPDSGGLRDSSPRTSTPAANLPPAAVV